MENLNIITASNENINNHNSRETQASKRRLRRFVTAASLVLLTAIGVNKALDDYQAQKPQGVELSKNELEKPEQSVGTEAIDNSELSVGTKHDFASAIITINPKELNVRKQPVVINPNTSGGENNVYNLNDSINVVNPVFVKTDLNGNWFMAADSRGRNYFFTGNNGGITLYGSEKKIENLSIYMSDKKAKVVATTNEGNIAKNSDSSNFFVATVFELGSNQG